MSPKSIRCSAPTRRQQGVSLVELAIVLCIIAVLAGNALQSFEQTRQAKRLESVAALLRTDIQFARSSSVAMGLPVRMHVESTGDGGSCYLIYAGPPSSCNCAGAMAACSGGALALRTQHVDRSTTVSLNLNVRSMVFDGTQGTVTPTGTFALRNAQGDIFKVIVNVMGRTRTCRLAGSVQGYPAC